jgi:pyridoxal phosphate enzyme (YggS family)
MSFPSCSFVPFVVYCSSVPVAENIALVRERIAAAARRAGRQLEEIELIAVSKTFPPERIREAYAAGLRRFGESQVQEFSAKAEVLRDLRDIQWHMIGHLQANKATKAVELFAHVDSVDSLRLARRLNAAAAQAGKKLSALIEINIGGEQAKSGVAPESAELEEMFQAAPELNYLQIRGLMTVPPFADDPEAARPYFRRLRELQERIAARNLPGVDMSVLSMGMSHDFEIAIEQGSTCVRVGTAIFGERG